jgi:hypothetical protein
MAFSVVAALVAWLPDVIGAPAYGTVPDPRPMSFVDVSRTGGDASIGIDNPVIAIRCWSGSAYEAEALALKVRDAMLLRAVEIPQVRGVTVNSGPYDSTESSRQSSQQVVFNLITEL